MISRVWKLPGLGNLSGCGAVLWLACVPSSSAQLLAGFDTLDGSEPGAPSPEGIVVVDFWVNEWWNLDRFTAAGIRAQTYNGATFRYKYYSDPNYPEPYPVVFNPGRDDRFVTCFSENWARNSTARFENALAAAAGGYWPPSASPTITEEHLNIAFFQSPPYLHNYATEGYVARIALDVSGLGVPNSAYGVFQLGLEPTGAIPVMISDCPGASDPPGTVWASFDHPELMGRDWGVFIIPEPASAWLLLVSVLIVISPRR